jgi:hypothetical protein
MNIPPEVLDQLRALRGCVSTVVLTGNVESAYASCHEELRSFNDRNGFTNVEYRRSAATLVEAGRDAELQHMAEQKYAYCLQIDADATFNADSLVRILHTAFNLVPNSDAVGAYCQLKGSYSPTIDTGSGMWEIHFPGEGVLPVIRTGGHFLLVKASAVQKMGAAPWFRTRHAPRALDILAEVDNYARTKLSGRNPFSESDDWQKLLEHAKAGAAGGPSSVGEDSGFCDRLKACGGNIYVDSNIVTGHVYRDVITPKKLIDLLKERERKVKLACGVLG